MKLAHDELSRRIAEHIEPLSEILPQMDPQWIGVGEYSPKRLWRWCWRGCSIEWQHRSMLEPEMTVMLKRRLIEQFKVLRVESVIDYTQVIVGSAPAPDAEANAPKEEEAVLKAYALAYKLVSEEELM